MEKHIGVRPLYKPIQPSIRESAGGVTYAEFLPESRLQQFIYCYWQLKSTQQLSGPFKYRVVADGCIDVFFELSHPQENLVMGFCRQYVEALLDHTFNYVGVRFFPTIFPQLFNVKASELSNRMENLADVVPGLSRFIRERFSPLLDGPAIKSSFDQYFLKQFCDTPIRSDNRLCDALHIILQNAGRLNVERDLDTGVSARHLRRIFDFYIGDTPKAFCKVVRFQHVLQNHWLQRKPTNTRWSTDGYYDQAHFIREFKDLYGTTPGKVRKNPG
jgi:hypothetical protein